MADGQSKPGVSSNGEQGFTLVEVIVAMAIFAIGFLAVGSMQISSINVNASSRLHTEATALANKMNERLMMLPYGDDFLAAGNHPADKPMPADFAGGSRFSASYFIQDATPTANTKTVQVQVAWQVGGRTRSVTLDFIKADL